MIASLLLGHSSRSRGTPNNTTLHQRTWERQLKMELKTVLILTAIYIGEYFHEPPSILISIWQQPWDTPTETSNQTLTSHKLSASSLSPATRAQQQPCLTERSPRSTSKSYLPQRSINSVLNCSQQPSHLQSPHLLRSRRR